MFCPRAGYMFNFINNKVMTPKNYFDRIEKLTLNYQQVEVKVFNKKVVRYVGIGLVYYSLCGYDSFGMFKYDLINNCVGVPLNKDYSVRMHLIRHGYTVFTLTV